MATTGAVCEHLHLPLQSGSDRTLAAMHRGYTGERYLDRLAAARAAVDDLAVTTDLIVGFPGETDDDFERTLEVVAEAQYDSAYTFIFSPRPGTEAAGMVDQFVAPEVSRGTVRSAAGRGRAVGARPARSHASAATRKSSSRDRASAIPGDDGAHPAEQAGALRAAVADPAGRLCPGARHECGGALPPRHVRRAARAGSAPHPHPGGRALSTDAPAPFAIVGSTATGKSALAMAVARVRARRRDRLGRLDAGVPGDGHRHREADVRRAARGPASPHRRRRSVGGLHGRRVPPER